MDFIVLLSVIGLILTIWLMAFVNTAHVQPTGSFEESQGKAR